MEAGFGRRVRSGKEYEHLFPRPTGKDKVIAKGASVDDTVGFIQKNTPKVKWQTEKFTKAVIDGDSLNEKCSQVWHWVYKHIPYKRDEEGIEQVRSPRRAFYDRNRPSSDGKVGVDCDCYTVFISSVLMNLRIPHKYRITKYPQKDGSIPRWQHIYIVVPKDGDLDYELENRSDYIVLDCVKENYNDEQPFIEYKDYDATMRLDYLDGFDEEEYQVPKYADARDLAEVYDEEELGKLGQWLKKAAKNVGTAVKKVAQKVAKVFPVTVVLRNAILLAMKVNFMNVAKRLRYGYLSESQAKSLGMNMSGYASVKRVVEKAQNTFKDAGGNPDNLRKAILNGKGNKDKRVPLSGLDGLGNIYGDEDEIRILQGLGEPASAASIAAAIPVITALSAALKQIKDLFPKGSQAATEFESETDAEAVVAVNTISEDSLMNMEKEFASSTSSQAMTVYQPTSTTAFRTSQETIPVQYSTETNSATTSTDPNMEKPSLMTKATTWVKENTLLTAGIVLGAATLTYLALKKKESPKSGLSGIPGRTKKRRQKKKTKTVKKKGTRPRIKAMLIK